MIPAEWLAAEFERVWPWLEKSLACQPIPTHEKFHIWDSIASGRSHLWPAPKSAIVTEETTYPNGSRVLFAWLAGGDLRELEAGAAKLAQLAKSGGCVAFGMVVMRDGFSRVFPDYQKAGMTLVKDLR